MTRFFLIVFCAVALGACKPGIPKEVIQPEEMEKILYDIHLVDGYISSIPTPDSAKKVSAPYYKGIFKKYGIDSAKHANSMAYYYKRPDLLTKMYEHISAKMAKARDKEISDQAKRDRLIAQKEEKLRKALEAKKADSVKKANQKKQADSTKATQGPKKAKLRPSKSIKK